MAHNLDSTSSGINKVDTHRSEIESLTTIASAASNSASPLDQIRLEAFGCQGKSIALQPALADKMDAVTRKTQMDYKNLPENASDKAVCLSQAKLYIDNAKKAVADFDKAFNKGGDPRAKALEIETDVQSYLDHTGPRAYAIEDNITATQALAKVHQEIDPLWKDRQQLETVGKELEKLSNETFSTLPNVQIGLAQGRVDTLNFKPSGWDFAGQGHSLTLHQVSIDGGFHWF